MGTIDSRSRQPLPGVMYGDESPASTVTRSFDIMSSYLHLFSDGAQNHWNLKSKPNQPHTPGGHLCTSLGIATLILLLDSLVKDIRRMYHLSDEDFRGMATEEFVNSVKPYCMPIVEFFQAPSFEDVHRFRIHRGATAPVNGMREMQAIIQRSEPTYKPEGLKEYLEERERKRVDDLNKIYRPLEQDLLQLILVYLKNRFGESTDDWFFKGPPPAVKDRVVTQHNKNPARNIEECFSMPTDGKLVMEFYRQDFQKLLRVPDFNPHFPDQPRGCVVIR